MDNRDRSENPGQTPGQTNSNTPTNWAEEAILWFLAMAAFIFWTPTKALVKKTYGTGEKHDEPNALNIIIGIVLSLAVGIGVGYDLGWRGDAGFWTWSLYGIGSAAAMFIYGWTSLYRLGVRHAFRLSEKLWSHVNIDATEPRRYYGDERDEKGNPAWFSQLLVGATWIGLVLGALTIGWNVMCAVQANQAGWGWLGWICAAVTCLVGAVAILWVVIGSFELSGKFGLFVLIVGAVLTWMFWGPVSGLVGGLFANLSGNAWGNWGYVPGFIVGAISAVASGAFAGTLLYNLRIRLIAAGTGVATTWALASATTAVTAQIPLGEFAVVAPAVTWLGHGLVLLFTVGFAFPLLHIFCTHVLVGLKKLLNVFELMDDVYGEKRGGYREFFLHIVNLVGTGAVIWFAPTFLGAAFGLTNVFGVWGITAVLALVAYAAFYELLDWLGSWPLGLASAAAVGTFAHGYAQSAYDLSQTASVLSGIAAAAVTFVFGFPAVYIVVRTLTNWLSNLVRDGLVALRKNVLKAISTIWDELFEAAGHTYGDQTPYREVFTHTFNIVLAVAVAVGAVIGGLHIGVAAWLAYTAAAILTFTSYAVVGRVLKNATSIGFLTAAALGVVAGTFVFGAQPEVWGHARWALAVAGGLVGAAITFGAAFPWAYLIVRAVANVIGVQHWLRPLLVNTHAKVWGRVAHFFLNFKSKFAAIQERFAKMRERFGEKYSKINDRLNKGGK